MAIMTSRRLICVAIILVWTAATNITAFENKECPPGYLRLSEARCVFIGSATTWEDALHTCRRDIASLYSYDINYSLRLRNTVFNLTTFLLTRGINMTWSGLSLRDGKARLEGIKHPRSTDFLGNLEKPNSLIGWANCQSTETGNCRASQINGPGLTVLFSLKKCETKLPFLCMKRSLQGLEIYSLPICPSGSIGSYSLTRCYSLNMEQVTYQEAASRCESQEQRLARVDSLYYKNIVLQVQFNFMEQEGFQFWVDGGRNCTVLDVDTRLAWDCNQKLAYMCEQPTIHTGTNVTLNVSRNYVNKQSLAAPGDFEVFFNDLHTREATATYIECYVSKFNPILHQVKFYHNGKMLEQLQGSTRHYLHSRQADVHHVLFVVGYYWCEVLNLNSGQLQRSNRVFVRSADDILHAGSTDASPLKTNCLTQFNFNLNEGHYNEWLYGQWYRMSLSSYYIAPQRFRENGTVLDFLIWRRANNTNQIGTAFLKENLDEAKAAAMEIYKREAETKDYSLVVRNFDYCLAYTYTDNGTGEMFHAPDTMVGAWFYSSLRCIVDGQPIGKMKCEGEKLYGAYWGEFQMNEACDTSSLDVSGISEPLRDYSQKTVISRNAKEIINEVNTLTHNKVLYVIDVIYITIIIENVVAVPRLSPEVAEGTLETYTRVVEVDSEVLQLAVKYRDAGQRLIKCLDKLPYHLAPSPSGFIRVVSKDFATEVWDLKNPAVKHLTIGLQFSQDGDQRAIVSDDLKSIFNKNELLFPETESAIIFSKAFLQQLVEEAQGGSVRLIMNIYLDPRLFRISRRSGNYTLNSKVISAEILVNGSSVRDLRGTNVTTVFLPEKKIRPEYRKEKSICAYWDEDRVTWSTDGCYYGRVQDDRDVCFCDHLTNFAVLLDFHGQEHLLQEHALALSIITIIGLSLSIVGLSLTILSFIVFKKLRQTRQQQTLFHLALAELCSWVIFLAGINQTHDSTGCVAVAALLHYFIVVSFMWMLMEAVLHALLFVKVYGTTYSNYMLKTAIPAWGVPLIPVVITLVVDYSLYRGGDKYCWMSLMPFYYAFALPVGIIILSNLVLYILTVVSLCRKPKAMIQNNQSEHNRMLRNFRASVFSFVLLGLSWIFGYMALFDARIVFQYVFTITCSTQGFFIFLIFTLRDKKARDSWKNMCCKTMRRQ